MISVYMIVVIIIFCVKPAPKLPFRNHVYVMSVFKAKDSEGTINADLTGIQANFQCQLERQQFRQVVLTVVMNTTRVLSERDNSKIKIDKFEVTILKIS